MLEVKFFNAQGIIDSLQSEQWVDTSTIKFSYKVDKSGNLHIIRKYYDYGLYDTVSVATYAKGRWAEISREED